MRLICAADLHLGRTPSRLPETLGVPTAELTPAAAWRNLVDRAVAERVDAVLLAGDVVEDRHDFFEAYADLQSGLERLAEAGIAVFAVSGNHDVEVLPRLAEELPDLHLLGRGGSWECVPLERGGERVRILGWSFPSESVPRSPFDGGLGGALDASGGGPLIGLLHGDRDGSAGPYAPFRSWELEDVGADLWLLGHVHVPDPFEAGVRAGYLGSLSAADPGEGGVRGAWRATIGGAAPGEGIRMERLAVAPLRYETVPVPLEGLERATDVGRAVLEALRLLHERTARDRGDARAVGCRLVFTGRSHLGDEVRRILGKEDPREIPQTLDGVVYFVHAWTVEVRPAVALPSLAARRDPLGVAARTLMVLEGDDEEARRELLDEARPRLVAVLRSKAFAPLGRSEPNDDELIDRLRGVALRTLDELWAQKEGERTE